MQPGHVELGVADPTASAQWYVEVLGFEAGPV
jgi:catechol 2,3-dioxygenase-like lactoylglutathione lyase family enzyme